MIKHVAILLIALALAACQSSGSESESTDKYSPKKAGDNAGSGSLFGNLFQRKEPRAILLPPDLVGSANDKVRENHDEATERSNQRVLPEVAAASIVNDGEQRWLRVETDAQVVWDKLVDFWAAAQVDLVEFQPAAGLMETDWIEDNKLSEEDEGRTFSKMLNRLTGQGALFNKFSLRLERESENVTLVFVTHRTTARLEQQFASPQKIPAYGWIDGESDPEKVAQLLQVMVLLFENTA